MESSERVETELPSQFFEVSIDYLALLIGVFFAILQNFQLNHLPR